MIQARQSIGVWNFRCGRIVEVFTSRENNVTNCYFQWSEPVPVTQEQSKFFNETILKEVAEKLRLSYQQLLRHYQHKMES